MGISISGSTKIQSISFNNSSSINAPNWELVPHKGMQTPSKDELIKQIRDLSAKRSKAVTDNDFASLNVQEAKLSAQYISSVSPDRKTLYHEAAQAIRSQKQNKNYSEGEKTLVDYLNEHDGVRNNLKNGKPSSLSSGGSITPIYNSRGSYDYDVSVGGNVVLSSNQGLGGWTFTLTPAELQKKNEFNQIFNNSYTTAKHANELISTTSFVATV